MKGKWHSDYSKDQKLTTIDDLTALPNGKIRINSCGKNESHPDGTEGTFDIVNSDRVIIRSVHFNVPNDTSENKSIKVTGINNNYTVTLNGQDVSNNRHLGTVSITIKPVDGKKLLI
jgi:hypothetical protein